MSSTIIKALWPGEKYKDHSVLRNSWGSAPLVWDFKSTKYIGPDAFWVSKSDSCDAPLWKTVENTSAKPAHRNVMRMTFDNAIVYKKDYARAAADIRDFIADCPSNDGANHWPTIAELFESDPNVPAIGFHWTTVTPDPFQGKYDEATGNNEPTDWSHYWDLYAEIDRLAA